MWCKKDNNGWVLELRLQPRASHDRIVGIENERLKVRVTDPPIDNAANDKVIKLLSKAFGVGRSKIRILSGHSSRDKRICIIDARQIPPWLAGAQTHTTDSG